MVIPEGYKKTEMGIIPEDWEVKPLNLVAPLQRGFDLPSLKVKIGNYPVVFSNGIGAYHSNYKVKGPGVVTGRSGTIGKVHYLLCDYWPHNTTLWVTDFLGNNEKFIFYLFQTIKWENYNSGSGVPTLNRNDVHNVLCRIPAIPEQIAIAQALSDIDSLIANLEKMIEKKKNIKQGAMQELLTGKRRLPGFDGIWKEKHIGEVCEIIGGGTPSKANINWWKGNIPWISSSDLVVNSINNITISKHISNDALLHSATKLCPKDSILVVSRVGVGKVAIAQFEICTSQDFTNLVAKEHNPLFLAYLMSAIMKRNTDIQGTSITGVTSSDISSIKIPF